MSDQLSEEYPPSLAGSSEKDTETWDTAAWVVDGRALTVTPAPGPGGALASARGAGASGGKGRQAADSASGRCRRGAKPPRPVRSCNAEGCCDAVSTTRFFGARLALCERHVRADEVHVEGGDGTPTRFCFYCHTLHPLDAFSPTVRSVCYEKHQRRLAAQAARRQRRAEECRAAARADSGPAIPEPADSTIPGAPSQAPRPAPSSLEARSTSILEDYSPPAPATAAGLDDSNLMLLDGFVPHTSLETLDVKLLDAKPSDAAVQSLWPTFGELLGGGLPPLTECLVLPGCVRLVLNVHAPIGQANVPTPAEAVRTLSRRHEHAWSKGQWDATDCSTGFASCANGKLTAEGQSQPALDPAAAPLCAVPGEAVHVLSATPVLYHCSRRLGTAPVSGGFAVVPSGATEFVTTGLLLLRASRVAAPSPVLITPDAALAAELNAFAASDLSNSERSALRHAVLPDLGWLLQATHEGWLFKDHTMHTTAGAIASKVRRIAATYGLSVLAERMEDCVDELHKAVEMVGAPDESEDEVNTPNTASKSGWRNLFERLTSTDDHFNDWRWKNEVLPLLKGWYTFIVIMAWAGFHGIIGVNEYRAGDLHEALLQFVSCGSLLAFIWIDCFVICRNMHDPKPWFAQNFHAVMFVVHCSCVTFELHVAGPTTRFCLSAPLSVKGFTKLNFVAVNLVVQGFSQFSPRQHLWTSFMRLGGTLTSRVMQPIRCDGLEKNITEKILLELFGTLVLETATVLYLTAAAQRRYNESIANVREAKRRAVDSHQRMSSDRFSVSRASGAGLHRRRNAGL